MKRVIAGVLAAVIGGVLLVGCELEESPGSNDTTPDPTPTIGRPVEVGSLELTILSVERYDARQDNSWNTANYRARVRVRMIKGDEYEFTLWNEFTLINALGVGYKMDWTGCTDCPDKLLGLNLYGSTPQIRYVYFEVEDLDTPLVAIRYEPGLSTTEPVRISLR